MANQYWQYRLVKILLHVFLLDNSLPASFRLYLHHNQSANQPALFIMRNEARIIMPKLKTYKVHVTETEYGYYLIKAKSSQEAEDIYYGNELGEIGEIISNNGEYSVEDIEEVK